MGDDLKKFQEEVSRLKAQVQARDAEIRALKQDKIDLNNIITAYEKLAAVADREIREAEEIIEANERIKEAGINEMKELHRRLKAADHLNAFALEVSRKELMDLLKTIEAHERVEDLSKQELIELYRVLKAFESLTQHAAEINNKHYR
jgi:chromosome segregation ATPase